MSADSRFNETYASYIYTVQDYFLHSTVKLTCEGVSVLNTTSWRCIRAADEKFQTFLNSVRSGKVSGQLQDPVILSAGGKPPIPIGYYVG